MRKSSEKAKVLSTSTENLQSDCLLHFLLSLQLEVYTPSENVLLIQERDTELGTCVAHTELFKAGQDTCTPSAPSCPQTNPPSRPAGATSRSPAACAQGGDTQAGPLNTARISLGCMLDLEMARTVL